MTRRLTMTLLFTAGILWIAFGVPAITGTTFVTASEASRLTWRQAAIIHTRAQVHACQTELHRTHRPVAQRVITGGKAYRRWVLNSWRADRRMYCGAVQGLNADPRRAIRYVFGSDSQAVAVSHCETGGKFNTNAGVGKHDYWGLFQVSSHWRATVPGWGWTPLRQAFHAREVLRRVGSWSPTWSCA